MQGEIGTRVRSSKVEESTGSFHGLAKVCTITYNLDEFPNTSMLRQFVNSEVEHLGITTEDGIRVRFTQLAGMPNTMHLEFVGRPMVHHESEDVIRTHEALVEQLANAIALRCFTARAQRDRSTESNGS